MATAKEINDYVENSPEWRAAMESFHRRQRVVSVVLTAALFAFIVSAIRKR